MIEANKSYVVKYPFCRDKQQICDEEGFVEIDTWRPGIKFVDGPDSSPEDPCAIAVADAHGEMILAVVDVHKPRRIGVRS